MTTPNTVEWQCRRCRISGTLPQLHDTLYGVLKAAIERGHERRAPGCHLLHGLAHVRAVHNGKTMRFGESPSETSPPAADTEYRA